MDQRLLNDMQAAYGLAVTQIQPLTGGWLNELWKVTTQRGDLLVKRFSHRRYSAAGLEKIEQALERQRQVAAQGIPSPEILLCGGKAVRRVGEDLSYMVTTFCPGHNECRETVTPVQLKSLGDVCGRLHRAFSALPRNKRDESAGSAQFLQGLWNNFRTRKAAFCGDDPPGYQHAVLAQKAILHSLTVGWLDSLPRGVAHEDFTPDNLLFDENGVTAVIDFDRNCRSFLWHDVGRALLSFCLTGQGLDREKTAAFTEGYTRHLPVSVPDALRITWCIEASWWITPEGFRLEGGKAAGYREDILWLTNNWFQL